MPGFEKSSETIANRNGNPRVGGLFGGVEQAFQTTEFFDGVLNPANIHWRAKYARGDYGSRLLDWYAQELMDWFDSDPGVPMAIVVSDTPAALAALRARGDRPIDIVIGVSGNPALDEIFGEFRVPPAVAPPRTHSVLDERSAAAKKLAILLDLLTPDNAHAAGFNPLDEIPNPPDDREAEWPANTIVIITNYSNPGWEREVEETYEAAYRYNSSAATLGNHRLIRIVPPGRFVSLSDESSKPGGDVQRPVGDPEPDEARPRQAFEGPACRGGRGVLGLPRTHPALRADPEFAIGLGNRRSAGSARYGPGYALLGGPARRDVGRAGVIARDRGDPASRRTASSRPTAYADGFASRLVELRVSLARCPRWTANLSSRGP